MTEPKSASWRNARADLGYVDAVLATETDAEHAVTAYLAAKTRLADHFQSLLLSSFDTEAAPIVRTCEEIAQLLRLRVGHLVPGALLKVGGYGRTHQVLLSYLTVCSPDQVSADRLRVLTAEQVHTERRVRELRDLGYDVRAVKAAGQNQYRLAVAAPDLIAGARTHLSRALKSADWDDVRVTSVLQELALPRT